MWQITFSFLECCSVATTDFTDLSSSTTTSSTPSIFCSSTIGDGAHSSRETEQDELIGGLEALAVSSGAVGGDSGGEDVSSVSGKRQVVARKRRTLVGVEMKAVGYDEVMFLQAVYNTVTKEVLCLRDVDEDNDKENAIRVCRFDESSGVVELKRTMDWTALRGDEDKLVMMAMDGNNVLYGIIERKSDGVERVEILDQNTLEKKGLLDTDGLDNGGSIAWIVGASGHSVVVAVSQSPMSDSKWTSVTVFNNQQRQLTVSLDIALDGYWNRSSCVLANETTLLLSCGNNTNRVAVISLPPPLPSDTAKKTRTDETRATTSTSLTLKPLSVIYLVLSEVKEVYSLVWMPSDEDYSQSQLLTGHLWVTDYYNNQENFLLYNVYTYTSDFRTFTARLAIPEMNTNTFRVFEVDIKKVVSQSEQPEEITLYSMTDIDTVPLKNTGVFCCIDKTTIFGDCEETGEDKPCLFRLEYQAIE